MLVMSLRTRTSNVAVLPPRVAVIFVVPAPVTFRSTLPFFGVPTNDAQSGLLESHSMSDTLPRTVSAVAVIEIVLPMEDSM